MKRKSAFHGLPLVIILASISCTSKMSLSGSKLKVVTSFYPLYYFSQQVGGEFANVTNITPSGAEPHEYEPTARQIADISNSSLLILNGLGLEVWGDKIKQNIDTRHTLLVLASQGISTQQLDEEGRTGIDPHIWLSPQLARQMVDNIAKGFIDIDTAHADYYLANAETLKSKLADLDAEYVTGLKACAQSTIVTSHAAFGYIATTYHLHQLAITGLSPDAEPSTKKLAEIAHIARENNVKYIFFESLLSPKLAQTIADEIGAKTMVLNPIEGLTDNELAQGRTYFTEMQSNLLNLETALGCTQ